MQKGGIEFGAHTMHHPILRVSHLKRFAQRSKDQSPGLRTNSENQSPQLRLPQWATIRFERQDRENRRKLRHPRRVYFLNGPSSQAEVKQNPLSIRRIFISYKHSLAEYAALLSPINRYRSS